MKTYAESKLDYFSAGVYLIHCMALHYDVTREHTTVADACRMLKCSRPTAKRILSFLSDHDIVIGRLKNDGVGYSYVVNPRYVKEGNFNSVEHQVTYRNVRYQLWGF